MSFSPWPAAALVLLVLLIVSLIRNRLIKQRLDAMSAVISKFFRQTSDLLLVLDENLRIREVNRSDTGSSRINRDDYVGKNIEKTAFWPTSVKGRKDALSAIRRAMDGEVSVFVHRVTDTLGRSGFFRVKVFPIPSPRLRAPWFFCIARDITVDMANRHLLKRRVEVEDIVISLAEAANDPRDPRKRIPEILNTTGSFLGARRAFVMQTGGNGEILWEHLWSSPDIPPLTEDVIGLRFAELMPFKVSQEPVVLRDLGRNPEIPEEYRQKARQEGMGSMILMPLSSGLDVTHGYLGYTFSEADPPSDDSASILTRYMTAALTGVFSKAEAIREMVLFRQSVDAAGQGIALIDVAGKPVYANQAYLELTGRPVDSEEPIWNSYEGSFSQKVKDLILPMVRSGERWTGELIMTGGSGSPINTIESFHPIDVGTDEPPMVITITTDITNRKHLENQLIAAKKEAEMSNRAKSDYLANMSHEIRTPMNAVIGLAYLALQTGLDNRQRDYLTKINSAAKSLLNIINDILDLSKIESGRLELERTVFSLDELLDSTAAMAIDKAWEKDLKVVFRRPPDLPDAWVGDRFRLGQVLLNLFGNAIKFTQAGRICIAVDRDRPGFLRFAVEDTGIGMSEEQIGRLFDPFIQAEASITRKYGGTGLGLTISKQIVELMGGDISVESRPGEGSRFTFAASLDRPSHAESAESAESGDTGDSKNGSVVAAARKMFGGKSAFVVSADPESRHMHAESLRFLGMETTVCAGVKEALENPVNPDVLILDIDDLSVDPKQAAFALSDGSAEDFLLVLSGSMNPTTLSGFAPAGVRCVCRSLPYGITGIASALLQDEERSGGPAERQISAGGLAGGRILLVDDNHVNRQVGRELLENSGLSVDVATNGREAVEAFSSESYDLVLMDLHMPEMDGYEAASLLRQRQPDIPVIAMTASAMQEVKNGVMEAGFSGYLGKPIDPEQFYSAIGKAMGVPGSAFKKTKIAVTSTTPLPSIDGIDEKIGLRQTLGNKERYREYLLDFAESHGKDDESIQAALDSNDLQDAISKVHALRGAAGTIGAMTLNMFAGELEESLRSGSVPEMDTLKVFYSRINFIIDGIVSTISPPAGRRVLKPLLNELERLIRRSDKSALAVVDKIAGMTIGKTELSHLEKTRHALAHWDFDAALDALDDWRLESGNQV